MEPRVLLAGDLQVALGDLSALPATLVPGDKLTIPVSLSNVGDAAVAGKVSIKVYASADEVLDDDDVVLGTQANQSLKFPPPEVGVVPTPKTFKVKASVPNDPAVLPAGDYFLIAALEPTVGGGLENDPGANNTDASDAVETLAYRFGTFDARKNASLTLTDADGTLVTFSLSGKGEGVVTAMNDGAFFDVTLTGTDEKSKATVKTKKSKTPGDDGLVQFGDVVVGTTNVPATLASFTASTADLLGDVMVSGSLGAMTLRNVPVHPSGHHSITLGTNANAKFVTKLTLGDVSDTSIDSGTALNVTAVRWRDSGGDTDVIASPGVTGLTIKGNKKLALAGDFEAGLDISASSLGSGSVGKVSIAGAARSPGESAWLIDGDVAGLTVGSLSSTFAANILGRLGAFTSGGGGDVSGTLAARSIGNVTIKGGVTNALILAGANLGQDARLGGEELDTDFFSGTAGVSIGNVTVNGVVTNSLFAAGFSPGTGGIFLDGNDALLGAASGPNAPAIKAIKVGGVVSNQTTFAAAVYPKSASLNKQKVDPLTDARFFRDPGNVRDLVPPGITLALTTDTGVSSTDLITSDSGVNGTITDHSAITSLEVSIDNGTFLAAPNGVLTPSGGGGGATFAISAAQLRGLNNDTDLADGLRTIKVRATDAQGNVSSVATLAFTLDTTAPATPVAGLSPLSDSGTPGDDTTSFAQVTLTGTAEPQARLSLLLGETPLGTVLTTGGGAFQLPGVALADGANVFTASLSDAAGNTSQTAVTITRIAPEGNDPGAVLAWNDVLLETVQSTATYPTDASRAMAIESLAVYDTLQAVQGLPGFYVTPAPGEDVTGASSEAAASAAAHRVLVSLFPARKEALDAKLAERLALVADGDSEDAGVALGERVADAILALRAGDGSDNFVDYPGSELPGSWRSTAPMFDVALDPQWADLTPFAMSSPDQFLPGAPPDLTSAEYAESVNEIKDLGRATGSTRTADQTQIARFWADGSGTVTPPGHWNAIARQVASDRNISTADAARLFAQLNVALADAAIVAWNAKYEYGLWRPITAIQQADQDNNDATEADASWQPLLVTPPFPEYLSGHSTFSAAAAAVLTDFFGNDVAFSTTSTSLPGVTRDFTSFEQAAQEAGRSRIYGGIHYQFTNEASLDAGHELGQYVLDRFKLTTDDQAPKLSVAPGSEVRGGAVISDNLTLTGKVIDNLSGVATLSAKLDGAPGSAVAFDAQGNFVLPLNLAIDGSADGLHTITLTATDQAGNVSVPFDVVFTLDTQNPVVTLSLPSGGATLAEGDIVAGTAEPTGSTIVSLSYVYDLGTPGESAPKSLSFDPGAGAFSQALDLSLLSVGEHTLTVTAVDAAGHASSSTLDVTMPEAPALRIATLTPAEGADDVGVTFRPRITFTRAIEKSSLTTDNFYATDSAGEVIPANVVVSDDATYAVLLFTQPMPGGSTITLHVEGDTILPKGGTSNDALDADNDGASGGTFQSSFTTVSLAALPGTTLHGVVADPGADKKPNTFDDVRAGPDQTLMTADDVYLNRLEHVHVYIIGLEGQEGFDTYTDANGAFSFASVPAGDIKLAVDGRTAINVPPGVFFPEMVMDLQIVPGDDNTIMDAMALSMGHHIDTNAPGMYLPRLATSILKPVSDSEPTTIVADEVSAPELTPEERQLLTITVQPGSAIGFDGQPIANPQVGIATVPPELVREMLPPGLLQHSFDITIQAPGVALFTTPAKLTFPNVFGAAPGTQLNLLSFDHTTGRLIIDGTATVTPDGKQVISDPGSGVTHPGWHGQPPPGNCGGSGGPPPEPPPEAPDEVVIENPPKALDFITGTLGDTNFKTLSWSSPAEFPFLPPLPPGDCDVPQHRPNTLQQPFTSVTIEVDGDLARFMNPVAGGVPLRTQKFTLTAGSNQTKIFGFASKRYGEIYGEADFVKRKTDELWGAKIKVTVVQQDIDGARTRTISTYYQYRWLDIVDANEVKNEAGETAAFQKTFADGKAGFTQPKFILAHIPKTVTTSFKTISEDGPFNVSDKGSGPVRDVLWYFDPVGPGGNSTDVTIHVDDPDLPKEGRVGKVTATGTGIGPTKLSVNLDDPVTGYKAELKRVILALHDAYVPGDDEKPGVANVDDDGVLGVDNPEEMGYPGSDDSKEVTFDFTNGAGYSQVDITGPDGKPGKAGVDDDGAGGVDDANEYGLSGSDDLFVDIITSSFVAASSRFKTAFAGFMPSDRAGAGPDKVLGNTDDTFTAAQLTALDARINAEADDLFAEIGKDFAPISQTLSLQRINAGADVVMDWKNLGANLYGSTSHYDYDLDNMRQLIGTYGRTDPATGNTFNAIIPDVAQKWALAEYLNPQVADTGNFAVGINIDFSDPTITFAQYISNTVSHELGHTFGLNEGYLPDPPPDPLPTGYKTEGGTAQVRDDGNAFPFDIMMNGGAADPDLFFKDPTAGILKLATGIASSSGYDNDAELKMWRDNFNLSNINKNVDGIRQRSHNPFTGPLISVSLANHYYYSLAGELLDLGSVAADGAGGAQVTRDYLIHNEGHAPLTLSSVTLAFGGHGFSIVGDPLDGATLQPGETRALSIRFDPGVVGVATDTLRIESDSQVAPSFSLPLTAQGMAYQPTARVTLGDNNLGGATVGATRQNIAVATITNDGTLPLAISSFNITQGDVDYDLFGIPADIAQHPITLQRGESFTFGASFKPSKLGILPGVIDVATNDPNQPMLHVGVTGTGVTSRPRAVWGDDYVVVATPLGRGFNKIRQRSNVDGNFAMVLPANTQYEITIFDPQTGLVAHDFGVTPNSGRGTDLTANLVFAASTEPDTDGDGLPDDIEDTIGTSGSRADTDRDGINDFTEMQQNLDPLGGRAFATGAIASLPLAGEAKEIVLEGSTLDPDGQTAYLATGSYGVAVVDVTRFNKPVLMGQLDLPGNAVDLTVNNAVGVAAVATGDGGLQIVDISRPASPRLVQTIDGNFTQVESFEGIAYAVEDGVIKPFDMATGEPLTPLDVTDGNIASMAREGGTLFTLSTGGKLRAIEITEVGLVLHDVANMPLPGKLFVGGGTAYVGTGGGFFTADVSNHDAIEYIDGPDANNLEGDAIVANGSGLAVGVGDVIGQQGPQFGLDLFDVSDPTVTDAFLTRFTLPAAPHSVAIGSGIAFVADGTAGLQVVNFLPFDNLGQAPFATITTDAVDVDPDAEGFQLLEGSSFSVKPSITDDVQVRNVELLINGKVMGNDVSFPFELTAFALDSGGGTADVRLRVTDTGGNTSLSNTLMFQIVPDTFAPQVAATTPADGSGGDPGVRRMRVRFSEPMDPATLTAANFRLATAGPDRQFGTSDDVPVPFTIVTRDDDKTVQLNFAPLGIGRYRLTMNGVAITDRAGNALGSSDVFKTFSLGPKNPPFEVQGATPDFGVGSIPKRLVTADIDDDGNLDMVTANNGSSTVTVLYGDGAGGFSRRRDMAVGTGVVSVAAGDINGDGFLDLATINITNGTYSVLINDAAGGFEPAVTAAFTDTPGQSAGDVSLGDIDGDGDVDLVLVNDGGVFNSNAFFLRNDGTGAFTSKTSRAIPRPAFVKLGDVDGDGDLDMLTIPNRYSIALVHINNGTGTFTGGTEVSIASPFGVVNTLDLADVDGDSDLDLITDADSSKVAILTNNGSGTFGSKVLVPVEGASISVAAGDFNGDGKVDIVATNAAYGHADVLFNNGNGGFLDGNNPYHLRVYSMGASSAGVALGDVNNDGKLDIVSLGYNSNNVNVLRNEGAGTFGTPLIIAPAVDVAAGDLNGDGKPDLVAIDSYANKLLVLLNSAGEFPVRVAYTVGTAPQSIALADLDGDGDLDAVTANINSNNVSVLLNDGAGNLAAAVNYATANRPQFVALADLTGDGKPDIVTANSSTSSSITVLRNDGFGAFGSRVDFPSGPANSTLTIGDVDGDNDLDVIAGSDVGGYNASVLLLNDGTGTLGTARAIRLGGGTRAIALGDIDNDGDLDLVSTSGYNPGATLVIIRNDGTGDFPTLSNSQKEFVAIVSFPFAIKLHDVNGDGYADIVAANYYESNVAVYFNDKQGYFGEPTANYGFNYFAGGPLVFSAGTGPNKLDVVDMDGDGDPDIVTSDSGGGTITVLANNGLGSFGIPKFSVGGPTGNGTGSTRALAIGDLNGDGIADVVTGTGTANQNYSTFDWAVTVLLSTGDGLLSTPTIIGTPGPTAAVALGDLDGDGDLDIAFSSYVGGNSGSRIDVLRNNGHGAFSYAPNVAQGGFRSLSIAMGDVDGDGDLDIATADNDIYTGGGMTVYINKGGTSGFEAPVKYTANSIPQSIAIADVNGDHKPDLITANSTSGTLTIRVNDGAGHFTDRNDIGTAQQPQDVRPADIDDDGDIDLIVASDLGNRSVVSLFINNGLGSFSPRVDLTTGPNTRSIDVADIDGDGDLDILAANRGGGSRIVSIFINNGGGAFSQRYDYSLGSKPPRTVRAGDVDGDGDLDIVTVSYEDNSVSILYVVRSI